MRNQPWRTNCKRIVDRRPTMRSDRLAPRRSRRAVRRYLSSDSGDEELSAHARPRLARADALRSGVLRAVGDQPQLEDSPDQAMAGWDAGGQPPRPARF